MRKCSKELIYAMLLICFLLPILSTPVIAQDGETDIFTVGTAWSTSISSWDATCADVGIGSYYTDSALEALFDYPFNTTGDYDELIPVLATDWTFESRPTEMSDMGFMAYDGIKSMDITLREGVTFHDGSNWNATVAKWNIDRLFVIMGNINGSISSLLVGPYGLSITRLRAAYYERVDEWAKFATPSWNVSMLAGPTSYAEWGYSADYYNYYPTIAGVTILEDLESGGTIRIEFNQWREGPGGLTGWAGIRFISMEAYKDYFTVPIFGYGQDPSFPQNNPAVFPGHLIGTGPYIFEEHNTATNSGSMKRFTNWWNSSAQRADGWHKVERVGVTGFPHTEAGYATRNIAMLAGDIDWARDRSWEPLDPDLMKTSPFIKYESLGLEPMGENIVLNCINETYLRYWDEIDLNISHSNVPGYEAYPVFVFGVVEADDTIIAHGINRAFRKALSYAFDYDTFVTVVSNNRVVRSGGLLAKIHEHYNPSIPLAYHDLTIARQALIDDPYWGDVVTARDLSIANDTDDWNWVADHDPIYKMEYNWDTAHIATRNLLITALEDIGCGIILEEDIPDTYTRWFDGTYSFPWFTTDGWAHKIYYPAVNSLPMLYGYHHSPGVVERDKGDPFGVISDWSLLLEPSPPYPPDYYILPPYSQFIYNAGYNMAFSFNVTCDAILDELQMCNETREVELYDNLADWSQNFQYQNIFLGNDKQGHATDTDWEVKFQWSTFRFNLVKAVAGAKKEVIPGFSVGFVLSASLIAFIGIAYKFMKKKEKL